MALRTACEAYHLEAFSKLRGADFSGHTAFATAISEVSPHSTTPTYPFHTSGTGDVAFPDMVVESPVKHAERSRTTSRTLTRSIVMAVCRASQY